MMIRLAVTCMWLVAAMVSAVQAQDYPARPVRIVVSFPPGGNTDIVARLLAEQLGRQWGRSVLVENRAGAGGTVGIDYAAKAPADGYTLALATLGTNATAPSVYPKLPYDPVRDFAYIAPLAFTPNVLVVNPKMPVRNLAEFIAHARANKGKLTYSSPGVGLSNHLAMELFLRQAGIDALHVPYKGAAPATAAAVAGEVDMSFDAVSTSNGPVRAGTLRALAVSARSRAAMMPDVPTFAEAGVANVEAYTWTGLAAPTGTPREIITRLHRDVTAVMKLPEMRERLAGMGAETIDMSPDEFQAFIRTEAQKWGDIARRVGAKME